MTYQITGLADRAAAYGFHALADCESLELLLGRAHAQGAKTYAQALLQRFGSVGAVLGADLDALDAIVGRVAAIDLKVVHDAGVRVQAQNLHRRSVLSSWDAVKTYVQTKMAGLSREEFRVLFLDKKNQLIEDRLMGTGTVDHAPVYPREIARAALLCNASAVILVHNHPSGDPTPSGADIAMTRKVVDALKALDIVTHDHLVAGSQGVASLKALGLM